MPTGSIGAVLLLVGLTAACASEPRLPPIDRAREVAQWEEWKAKRTAWLSIPGRPQSFTGLRWLRRGRNTIGADSTNDIRLTGTGVPARVGTLIRDDSIVVFRPTARVLVTFDSLTTVAAPLRTDADPRGASSVIVGSAGFRIIKRVDSIGVRVWNGDRVSPEVLRREIAPLAYFTWQDEWRIGGRLTKRERPETLAMATNSGVAEVYVTVGSVAARVTGKPISLTAFSGNGPKDLFLSFSDETSGEETYGFRFLHAALDTATNVVTLDFNRAYNPDCAFSSFTTCPLPPPSNRIPARVTAGERVVRHLTDASPPARGNGAAK